MSSAKQTLAECGIAPTPELEKFADMCIASFKALDTEAPFGQLSFSEFQKVPATKDEAQKIFNDMDLDSDSMITLQEYVKYMVKKQESNKK